MTTLVDRKENRTAKKSGRLPLFLLGIFAIACLAALIFVGDLARYQEAGIVEESQAALRDVNNPEQLDQALKRFPANRILKLIPLANEKSAEIDAAVRKVLAEAEPASLATINLTTANRSDLDALRRDLKTAESNLANAKSRTDALIKAKRDELQGSARSLGLEAAVVTRFMTAVDEQHAAMAALADKALAARAEYFGAYDKCAALLVREFGTYKVTAAGQFIFRLQPAADSYNAATTAMAAATKRATDLEEGRAALKQSEFNRWKKFVGP